ncbi:interleukin-15 isoform X7 [Cricetulus griseus]|nr:interleukin-15 isoform X7 [Cricetulus griseus]XP_027261948.1 interleukin-15 isoform X7 [Cricetulus griseus]
MGTPSKKNNFPCPRTPALWGQSQESTSLLYCHFGRLNPVQSIHIDATLYTDSDFHPSCKVTAMNCFLLELRVILHEYSNERLSETVRNVIFLANSSLSSNKNITEYGCKECEELEEKDIKEFLQSFIRIVQMFINTS